MRETKVCPVCKEEHNNRSKYCNKAIYKECSICNKEFETACNPKEKSLCSTSCISIHGNKVKTERRANRVPVIKTCQMCGTQFDQKQETKDGVVGCSPVCRFQIRNGSRECDFCGKEYIPKADTSKVCSYECSGKMAQGDLAREKRSKTNITRYGSENPFGSDEIKSLIREVNIERYGYENPMKNDSVKKKAEDTNIKKYGVKAPIQNKEIMNKLQKTNLAIYGHTCSLSNLEVSEKRKRTMIERYGHEYSFSSPEIQAKVKETNFERYGAENPFASKEIKEKIKSIVFQRYGAENYSNRETAEEELKVKYDRVIELYNEGNTEYEIAEEMGYEYITVRRVLLRNGLVTPGNISQVNKYWTHLINKKLGVEFKNEGAIFANKRLRVDLYNEDIKLAIDINPTITHSTQVTPFPNRKTTSVKYHQDRALAAQENGWELIQIFDWDSESDIIELLHSKFRKNKRIYARKCIVKEISHKESKTFLDENHRQEGRANSSIQYGLFYEEDLVQVMTFSKERFSRNRKEGSYELLRLTSRRRVTVVGGASKLLTAFQKSTYEPKEIKTFADFSKGTGDSYRQLGMTYEGFANMNAFYANISTGEAYKVTEVTNKFRKEYSNLGLTQKEYMNSKGFYRINDAGHKVFKWNRY